MAIVDGKWFANVYLQERGEVLLSKRTTHQDPPPGFSNYARPHNVRVADAKNCLEATNQQPRRAFIRTGQSISSNDQASRSFD